MTLREIEFITGFLIASLLLISIFGRKSRSKKAKVFILLVANVLYITSIALSVFHGLLEVAFPISIILLLDIIALRKALSDEHPNQKIYNEWHDDPANWRAGVFYYNPKDKRILPPKKYEAFGWTINFANPYSIVAFIVILIIAVLFMFVVRKYSS